MNQNAARDYVNTGDGEGRSKKSGNLKPKGFPYKCVILHEIRSRINGRLIRKYATIEVLLFSNRKVVAVEEDIGQFNDLFKMPLIADEEYNAILEDEASVRDDE